MPGGGHAGGIDHHLDPRRRRSARSASSPMKVVPRRHRLIEARRCDPLRRPAHCDHRLARARRRQIRHRRQMQARRALRLSQEHRAELAGADQADADGVAGLRALQQQTMEIYLVSSRFADAIFTISGSPDRADYRPGSVVG